MIDLRGVDLNLLVSLRYEHDGETLLARVKVPVGAGVSRFVRLGSSRTFVDLADVMANNLDLLFPGMEIETCSQFRVTRNAITERDEEEADDLLEMIEIELRKRKFAPVVRLQVDKSMAAYYRGRLAAELGLDEATDVFESDGMLSMRDLMEIALLDIPELRDAPHAPAQPVDFLSDGNLFHAIRDLSADAYGGYRAVTNVQAGGGLYAQRIVTRNHYDMKRAKMLALEAAGMQAGHADLKAAE